METIAYDEQQSEAIQNTAQNDDAPQFTRRETILTMVGVLLVMLLASLDQTIVSTAMPRIISDLQGIDRYTWVTTAYLLTSTIMVPIYGKLSDLFGRKPIFLVGVVLFLVGSALCGASQSMTELILFRAFQGLGAAALMPIAIAVIGDLFSPRERGKWQGITGGVFGLSSILGPTVGGWITDNATWRWVFYVNLPVGIVALLVLIFLMPALKSKATNARIDYIGAALLVLGTVPLMLALTWAGNDYEWLSWQILGLFAVSLVFLVSFFVYESVLEKRELQPIIEPSMFKGSIFSVSIAVTMIISVAMFGCILFLPLFAQGVLGITATNSGLLLSPLMLSLIASSVISGLLVSRFGRYKWVALLGMAVTIVGILLLVRLDVHSTETDLVLAMIVLGLGLGFGMSLYTLIVQNSVPNSKIGQATSSLTFFRQIGASIASAALGSVMLNTYKPAFHDAIPNDAKLFFQMIDGQANGAGQKILSGFDNPNILLSEEARQQVSHFFGQFGAPGTTVYNQVLEAVKVGLTQGIHNLFVISVGLAVVGFILIFFLKEVPLRTRSKPSAQAVEAADEIVSPVPMH
ncbi:MDR family MFS transporter [Ktedonospora formicarum]|uniref:MFS transporter n=1 Tax=Ktedonospora formicarum TaxID=2778364 RepID=A0A8J3I5Q7_9CHLR|nr:MDR family MFS transporter [Ktedonospora formicarum]GHO46597.1 MFS transporter [Ktedonospora formicarum]